MKPGEKSEEVLEFWRKKEKEEKEDAKQIHS